MIKKTLYPKTKRISDMENKIVVTEKLDGSNIGFFKLEDELLIAQRNNIITLEEALKDGAPLYKGLRFWLSENGENLKSVLNETSGIFGEWIGMGKLKYTKLDKKVYLFAKANINNKLDIYNLYYDLDLLKYSFINQEIPSYFGIVPIVSEFETYPDINDLNYLYKDYISENLVEGFVVQYKNKVSKYVRMKNGKLENHKSNS